MADLFKNLNDQGDAASIADILGGFDKVYQTKKDDRKTISKKLPDGVYVFEVKSVNWKKRDKSGEDQIALKWNFKVISPEIYENLEHEYITLISEKTITAVYRDFETLYVPGSTLLEFFEALPFLPETHLQATLRTNEKNFFQVTTINRLIYFSDAMQKFTESKLKGGQVEHQNPL